MHRLRTLKSSMTPTASLPSSCWHSAIFSTSARGRATPAVGLDGLRLRRKPTKTETSSSMPASIRS